LHGGVPFIGPGHGHGDRVSGVDLHMHVRPGMISHAWQDILGGLAHH
jgi:hypothetical protein